MPGKPAANRGGKESSNSTGELSTEKTRKYSIWPKWTDDEPATDKKEGGKPSAADGSRLRKGTTLSAEHIDSGKSNEEDVLPPSLSSDDISWVNPGTYITEPRIPVIVAEPILSHIDLISENSHLMKSELMCSIISQLQALWQIRNKPSLAKEGTDGENKEWSPWDHIQHKKEHLVPMLNPMGKYGVKIYWMGAWRKITVTDQIPLKPIDNFSMPEPQSEDDGTKKEASMELDKEVMLPRTSNTSELWPAILTKAILKVAALDYRRGSYEREFGDCNVIHMLTGWYPHTLPTRVESNVLWKALCELLPKWKRPPGEEETTNDSMLSEEGEGEGGNNNGDDHKVSEETKETINNKMDGIVTAHFVSACNGKHMTKAKKMLMNQSLEILKKKRLIPQDFDPLRDHASPMLIRQVRDIPLKLPPKERPPKPAPQEHAWLGYSHRRYEPWKDPPPTPLPPRWVEVVSSHRVSLSVHNVEEENELPQSIAQSPASPPRDYPVPTTTSGELQEDENDRESKKESESVNEDGSEDETEITDGVWMKYEDFRKAFSSVELFTPNANFKYTHSYKDLTATVENVPEEPKGKGRVSHSPATKVPKTVDTAMADDTNILFLGYDDEEKQKLTELHFILTCLSNWREGSKNMKTECRKSLAMKRRRTSILDSHNQVSNFKFSVPAKALSSSNYAWGGGVRPSTIPEADEEGSTAGSQVAIIPPPTLPTDKMLATDDDRIIPGSLVVEEFDWKSIETKLPLLRIISTGVKGAVMKLDGSQRIFKLHVKAPLGYHLNISSNTQFELANKDAAYNRMHREGIGFSKVYSGSISPLQPNSWAIVFREVLHVRKVDQFLVFSLNCPVPGHLLRVVDNDVCLEIPRVAHITEPQPYSPNRNGYTILCEMWTKAEPVTEGNNWKLRIISSDKDLPLCEGIEKEEDEDESVEDGETDREGEVVSEKGEEEGTKKNKVVEVKIEQEFYHREIRDYCLPDRDNIMLRYTLKVTKDCPITVQLSTSKKDAYIKLELYDGSSLMAVTQGRAYCFIPSYHLHSTNQSQLEMAPDSEPASNRHKYLLMATIIQDSWPLADTAWASIADIRAAEEEKANAVAGGGAGSGKGKKPPSASSKGGAKGKKSKGGTKDGGGGKESADGVQSSSSLSSIDVCKPHWTLRVALRQSDKEHFDICKDTEKEDELRSMQAAWETQQPGRVKKGQESRQKFLDSHAIKDTTDQQLASTTPSTTSISSSQAQLSATASTTPHYSTLQPPTGPVPLHRIDLSLYTKYSNPTPHVLTAEEREQRDEEKREIIRQYRAWRHSILQSRDQDRQFRNGEKLRQLEEAEKLQTELELTRKKMNRGREKIRQRYLAAEKARIEAEQAALKAAEAETAANARDSKAKGKKGKKK